MLGHVTLNVVGRFYDSMLVENRSMPAIPTSPTIRLPIRVNAKGYPSEMTNRIEIAILLNVCSIANSTLLFNNFLPLASQKYGGSFVR